MTGLLIGLYVAGGLLVAADLIEIARDDGMAVDAPLCFVLICLGVVIGVPLLVLRAVWWRA